MSYPYGDEAYPTIERFEHNADRLEDEYWNTVETLTEARRRDLARQPLTVNLTINGRGSDDDVKQLAAEAAAAAMAERYGYGDGWLPEDERVDILGLAFARTLAASDLDADEIGRFMQDLFTVLGDKVISTADRARIDAEREA